ncbi:unnamed protein product [Symbiodinium natans]|uniref:Uncharacterized protein n=1 Tax=Symbiodinium natans TaxID=878477 RepID=A0A812KSY8_9DINO|nr:unnamed protein product [Symbiodinium natans]CAE7589958.1 unnamed protein product [Symbiodinium natans]
MDCLRSRMSEKSAVDLEVPLVLRLPRKSLLAGAVLQHALAVVGTYLARYEPMIYKFGWTHDPFWRWSNDLYGYQRDVDSWSEMVILHVSHEAFGPAMLEASLINQFQGISTKLPGCRNVRQGGDTITEGATSEASCSAAVRVARNVVRDIGVESAAKSPGLLKVARCSESNAERDTHRVLVKQCKLGLPIPLRRLGRGELDYTVLRLRDWFQWLVNSNCIHTLTGLTAPDHTRERCILKEFWSRYRSSNGDHPVFRLAAQGRLKLESTVPLLYHGDEGRGRRRMPFLVTSWFSMIGRGARPADRRARATNVRKPYVKLRPNFKGHSFVTRYLQAAMPKKAYQNETVFQAILKQCRAESNFLTYHGVSHERTGEKLWGVVLAVTGDWAWLVKSGGLRRNFNHAVKSVKDVAQPEGICHLCAAGMKDHPFEHLTHSPSWLSTFCQIDPFLDQSPLKGLLHADGRAATLFQFDVWHTCHLGVCRTFAGSVLALLSETFPGRSKDSRFEALSEAYMAWCARTKHQALLTKLTKDTIGWDSNNQFPCGNWYKGSLSRTMCDFIEDMTAGQEFEDDMLRLSGVAVRALNNFLRGLYEADIFLDRHTASTLGEHGLAFLDLYSQLASLAVQRQRCLFVLIPKLHSLHHQTLQDLVLASRFSDFVVSPLCYSVQMSEDFIGRHSRTSRRVHPALCTRRCTERFLQLAYTKYVEAGYLLPAQQD